MKSILNYKFPIFLILVLYLVHLNLRDFSNPNQKPINADAKAYYAYLPAIFIYQDSQYKFVNQIDDKYYSGNKKDFLNETKNGKKVNKTFPGASILYLPFFLLAHLLALLFNLNADGYSYIYQFLFDFGYWFYLLLGAIYYVKLFRTLKFKDEHIFLSLFFLLVGTNILFYSLIDVTVTHIMNFAMINAVIYHCLKLNNLFINNDDEKRFRLQIIYIIALLLLIGITRPTNVLIVLTLFIFIPQKYFYYNFFKILFKPKTILVSLFIFIIISSIPFILWKWQTNEWIVYSYGNEGFDFTNPQFINFLFSYKKGWFVYTPLAFITLLFGLFYLFKLSKIKTILILVFYCLSVYIFSSWWCWYYGAGLSQRVMIDYSLILGFLILVVFSNAPKFIRLIFIILSFFSIIINIIYTYQVTTGIYPMGSPTKEVFWNKFLSFKKEMIVYEKTNWNELENIKVSLDSNYINKGQPKKGHQNYFIQTNRLEHYSPTIKIIFKYPTKKIIIKYKALPQTTIESLRLVAYSPITPSILHTIYLNSFCYKNSECKMEALIEFNQPTDQIEFYFWNGKTEEICDFYDFEIISYSN